MSTKNGNDTKFRTEQSQNGKHKDDDQEEEGKKKSHKLNEEDYASTASAGKPKTNKPSANGGRTSTCTATYSSFTPPPSLAFILQQFSNRLRKTKVYLEHHLAPLIAVSERPWRRLMHYIRMYLHFIKVLLRSLYLPDELHFYTDSFIRLTFSVYYVPLIAAIIALTHSELQRIVWVLVVPITQEMERQPYSVNNWYTLLNGVGDIFIKIIPFLALGMSVAVIGHKGINCVTEAMMDASITYEERDYPLLRSRARYMCREKPRLRFFIAMLVLVCTLFLASIHTSWLIQWNPSGTTSPLTTRRPINDTTAAAAAAEAGVKYSTVPPQSWNSTSNSSSNSTTTNHSSSSKPAPTAAATTPMRPEEAIAPSSQQVITYATWLVILIESFFVFFTVVHGAPPETLPASMASMSSMPSRRNLAPHMSYEMSLSRSLASSLSNVRRLHAEQMQGQVSSNGDGSNNSSSSSSSSRPSRPSTGAPTPAYVSNKPSIDYLGPPTRQGLKGSGRKQKGSKNNLLNDNHDYQQQLQLQPPQEQPQENEDDDGELCEAARSNTDSNYSIISSDSERERGHRDGDSSSPPFSDMRSTQQPTHSTVHRSPPPAPTSDGEDRSGKHHHHQQHIQKVSASSLTITTTSSTPFPPEGEEEGQVEEPEEVYVSNNASITASPSTEAVATPVTESAVAALQALHFPDDNLVKLLPVRDVLNDHFQDNYHPPSTTVPYNNSSTSKPPGGSSGTASGSNTSRCTAGTSTSAAGHQDYKSHFSDTPMRRALTPKAQELPAPIPTTPTTPTVISATAARRAHPNPMHVLTPLAAAPPGALRAPHSNGLPTRNRKLRFSSPTSQALLDKNNHQHSVLDYLCARGNSSTVTGSSKLTDEANRNGGSGDGSDSSSYRVIHNHVSGYGEGYFGDEVYNFIIYVENDWWKHNIHFMRYIGFWCAIGFGVLFMLLRSFSFGLGATITMLLYLNVPHLLGYTTLAISHAVLRCCRSGAWLLRHPDAVPPFLFLLVPYQVILLYTFYYFHHHNMTLLLLACVNVLLLARTIDLVRAFDTTAYGCVRWSDARTNRRLWPSLSMQLEDAYELQYNNVEEVSLDLSFDVSRMELFHGADVIPLRRTQVIPYGAARFYLHSRHFYAYTIPRVLTFQTSANVGSHKVRVAKVVLRAITLTALLIFTGIACGMVMQAAFPQLRPLPVRVSVPDDLSRLSVNHLVSHLDIMTTARPATAEERARLSAKWDAHLDALPHGGRDLYPHLCQRTFHNTTSLELALLSMGAYLFNGDEVRSLVKFMNAHFHSDWELRPRRGDSCVRGDSNHEPTHWRGYMELFSRRRDLSVIAVRGTDMSSFTDFLIDVNLFLENVLYQVLTQIIPGAVLIPKELVADTLRILSMPPEESGTFDDGVPRPLGWRETWHELTTSHNHSRRACQQNNFRRDFYVDAYNHLAYLGSRRHFKKVSAREAEWGEDGRPSHVILTGHSLGGAVAAILAAQLDVPAVVFSAPGVALLRHRFGIALHKLHRNVVSVIPSHDIVPLVGLNGGEVQHLQCMAARKDLCHAVEFTTGTLWRACDSLQAKFPSIENFY